MTKLGAHITGAWKPGDPDPPTPTKPTYNELAQWIREVTVSGAEMLQRIYAD
jgi:hypothetical protein